MMQLSCASFHQYILKVLSHQLAIYVHTVISYLNQQAANRPKRSHEYHIPYRDLLKILIYAFN